MKITGLESTIVAVPYRKPHPTALGVAEGPLVATLLRASTDEGVSGLAEVMGGEQAKLVVDSVEPVIAGEDPFDVERIQRKLYSRYELLHVHPHFACWALDGVTMALWDLVGRACGRPLYKVWGGAFRRRIPFWGWVHRADLETVAKETRELVGQGYDTLYIKVGIDPEQDLETLRVVREEAGDGVKIRVDANQAWSPGAAVSIIKRMERYGLEMVEQPVSMYDLDGMASVRLRVSTPILSHESSWTPQGVLEVVKKGAADAVQLDPRWGGGFTGVRRSAAIAETAGLPVVMHSYRELGVATAAFMQVIASSPNFIYANQTMYQNLVDDVVKGGMLRFSRGFVTLPDGPGIGVELDEAKVERYAELYRSEVKDRELERRVKGPRAYLGLEASEEDIDWAPTLPRY